MLDVAEDYIYRTGLSFIKLVLKRKTYDVGSVELKFYVIAKNVAALFYHTPKKEFRLLSLDLLRYIHRTERHTKYLDNVKHPAKKPSTAREITDLYEKDSDDEGASTSIVSSVSGKDPALTKSSRLQNRVLSIINR